MKHFYHKSKAIAVVDCPVHLTDHNFIHCAMLGTYLIMTRKLYYYSSNLAAHYRRFQHYKTLPHIILHSLKWSIYIICSIVLDN